MRSLTSTAAVAGLALTAVAVVSAVPARAGLSAERQCQKGRYDAAAKYAQCHDKAVGQLFATNDLTKLQPALSKCRVKFTDIWLKLQKKALGTGSTCDAPRFNDNGDGTVTDNLTGLQWEKKTDDDGLHDKDDLYSWSFASQVFLAGNSSAPALNKDSGVGP